MNHTPITTIENKQVLGINRSAKKSSMNNSKEQSSTENNTSVNVLDNSCAITMMYLGPPMIKPNGPYTFKIHADEILILQSYTAMGTKSVFKGCIKPSDEFTFKSYRLIDRHFDITIYINGIIDQHIFVCCEKGFLNQSHYQTKRSSCQLQSITKGIPCETCQSHQLMKFFPDEIEYDDPNDMELTSAQSVSPLLPTIPIKDTVSGKQLSKLVSDTITKSEPVTLTTKDNNEQTVLQDTNPTTYNQIIDSDNDKTLMDNQGPKNMNKEEVNQQTPNDAITELQQADTTVSSKIMNEDNKANISPAASLAMQQLLTSYLKLLHPQSKSNETQANDKMKSSTNNSEPNNTTESLTYSNSIASSREAKAKIQYTDSTSMSTVESKAESFVLIWLDQTIKKNYDTVESEQKLRAIVNSLVTCHTINEAINLIEQVQDQQIYLIVSGELGKELVSMNQIIDSSKLNSIYIFCRDQPKYTELIQLSNKVRAVFVEIDPLCTRLKEDTEQALKNLLPISTTSGTSKDEENQVKFLCSQLHRDLLFTMEYNNNARLELATHCSNIYKSNRTELKFINELKTEYHAGKAIWWYSRQTFLYKMLNKAFLNQDTSTLYKFHFFIKDLHMHLEQMHSLYKPSLASRVFTVFRGLSMSLEHFKNTIRDQINKLIAFDSFLSTSLDENVAKNFALDKQDPKSESVVFSMEIDADKMERPFADISRWSVFNTESEVLFSIGTVFRIVDVADEKTSDGIWIVRLSTVSEKDEKLQKETQQIQITLLKFFEDVLHAQNEAKDYQNIPSSNANVASIHYKQREYLDSLLFYERALETLNNLKSPDPLTKATYISNIAKTHMALGHDDKALLFYKEALDIRRHLCAINDPSLIYTLHTIGHIYRRKQNWNEAFEQYNQALELQQLSIESRLLSDPSSIATTCICIGNIFHSQQKYQEALDSFLKALEQQHGHLPEEHPALAFLYNNIGAMYYQIEQYDLALENQLKCLKIESKSLPKEHKTFAETYKNIATSYKKCRQFDQATEFAQKYIDQLKLQNLEGSKELDDAMHLLKTIQIRLNNTK